MFYITFFKFVLFNERMKKKFDEEKTSVKRMIKTENLEQK